jgi:hypothetical protein
MKCTFLNDFVAKHADVFFNPQSYDLRMELIGHLQGCLDCQDSMNARIGDVLAKGIFNPANREVVQNIIAVAEDDVKRANN